MPAAGEEARYSFAHLDNDEIVAVLVQDVRQPDRLDAIGRSLIEHAAVVRPRSRPGADDGWPLEATPATTPAGDDEDDLPAPPPVDPAAVARQRALWLDIGERLLALQAQHPDTGSDGFTAIARERLGRDLDVTTVRAALWWMRLTDAQREELNGLAPDEAGPVAMLDVCRAHRRRWL
jgi:hypothetical protein